ncbi:MAG: hypothetical protein U0Z53_25600 [Blastocatellia bacterium]
MTITTKAALVAAHPGIHLTINLTPSLIWQIEDYTERGATDRALDLTLKPAEALEAAERKFILKTSLRRTGITRSQRILVIAICSCNAGRTRVYSARPARFADVVQPRLVRQGVS